MPRQLSDTEVARIIYMELPQKLASLVMSYIGSEKLERQLLDVRDEEEHEPLIVKFFRYTLVADLRLRKWSHYLPEFSIALEESRYLTLSYLRKMGDIYLLGGLNKAVAQRLQGEIGDVISKLKGGTAEERRKIKGNAIERIAKRARVRQFRIAALKHHEGE